MKILSKATIGLEKSFRMMYNNIGLNSRETVPLKGLLHEIFELCFLGPRFTPYNIFKSILVFAEIFTKTVFYRSNFWVKIPGHSTIYSVSGIVNRIFFNFRVTE